MIYFMVVLFAFLAITVFSEWLENRPLGERKVIRVMSPEWIEGRIHYMASATEDNPYKPNTQRHLDYHGGYEYSREHCGLSETVVNWRTIHAVRKLERDQARNNSWFNIKKD